MGKLVPIVINVLVSITVVIIVAAAILLWIVEGTFCEGLSCLAVWLTIYIPYLQAVWAALVLIGAIPLLYAKIRKKILRRRFVYISGTLIILGFLMLTTLFFPEIYESLVEIKDIQSDKQRREALQTITFQLYKPTYLPSGYSTEKSSVVDHTGGERYTAYEDFAHPENIGLDTPLLLKDKDRAFHASEWWQMRQLNRNGNGPFLATKCPRQGVEFPTQEISYFECVLVATTPKGHGIYRWEEGYNLVIDNTLFIFQSPNIDLAELIKVVDSLVPVDPTDVELEPTYSDEHLELKPMYSYGY